MLATSARITPEQALADAKLYLLTQAGKAFYAFALACMPEYPRSKLVPVAGVVAQGPQLTLHTNPDIFPALPLVVRARVLEHEVLHLLHRHVPVRRSLDSGLWNIACFKPDEPILTTRGLKPIAQVQLGDEVVGAGRVTAVMQRSYSGTMYRVKPWGCEPVTATAEHPFLVVTLRRQRSGSGRDNGPWDLENYEESWLVAKDLATVLSNGRCSSRHRASFLAIPRLPGTFGEEELDLDPYMGRDRWSDPSHRAVLKRLPLNEDVAFVMGLYVAEGSHGGQDTLVFSFGAHEIGRAEQVANVFREFGFAAPVRQDSRSSVAQLHVASPVLGRAFGEWFGRGASVKRIPAWLLFHKNLSLVRAFLHGYFAGDGATAHRRRSSASRVAWTVSPTLARQIQLLGARLGELITVDFHRANNAGRIVRRRAIEQAQEGYRLCWSRPTNRRWKVTAKYILVPAKVAEESYEGPVWNIETETHRYLAGNVIAHNCDLAVNELLKPEHPDYVDPVHPERSLLCVLPERMPIPLPPAADAETYYMLLQQDAAKHAGKKLVILVSQDGKAWAIAREDDPRLGGGWKVHDLHPHFHRGQDTSDTRGEREAPLVSAEVIEAEIRRIVQEATKMAGTVPGNLRTVIDNLFAPSQDWRRVLRSFAGSVLMETRRRSFARPSRRHAGYPGRRRELGAHLACVVDTSGSMSDAELQAIGSELFAISRSGHCLVEVVEADAAVRHTYTLTEPTLRARMRQGWAGRGGTTFRPAFEWAMRQRVDGLIYFTDGYNSDREWLLYFRPPFPVLWVITAQGEFPAPWGRRLRLDKSRTP